MLFYQLQHQIYQGILWGVSNRKPLTQAKAKTLVRLLCVGLLQFYAECNMFYKRGGRRLLYDRGQLVLLSLDDSCLSSFCGNDGEVV